MLSNFTAIDVLIDNDDLTTTPVPNAVVHVYDVTNDVALPDLVADGDGHIPAGQLEVEAGTLMRYSVAQANGQCGYEEEVTT